MRLMIPALIVANGLALAWWQGWLDPWLGAERQPQRLERQVRPETMQILPRRAGQGAAPVVAAESAPAPATENASAASSETSSAPSSTTANSPASGPAAAASAASEANPPAGGPGAARAVVAVERSRCLLVPARDEAQAVAIAQQFSAAGISFERTPVSGVQGYVVYEAARASADETRRRIEQLQAGGVRDIYLLPGGPYRGSISLGFFRSESSARQQLAQLQARGFSSARIGEVRTDSGPIVLRASGQPAAIGRALAAASAAPTAELKPCD